MKLKKLLLFLPLVALLCAAGFPPNPAPIVTRVVGSTVTISWTAPTTYNDNVTVISPDVAKSMAYKLYSMTSYPTTGTPGFIGYVHGITTTQKLPAVPGTVCYALTTVVYNPTAKESARAPTFCVAATAVATVPPSTTPAPVGQICVDPPTETAAVPNLGAPTIVAASSIF